MRPLSLSFLLRAECVKPFSYTAVPEEQTGRRGKKKKKKKKIEKDKQCTAPHRTAPHRRGARLRRWQMVCAESGAESRAPRDQSERRDREEGLRCCFSSLLSSYCAPIFCLSLAPVSSAPLLSASHLLSPQPPTPVHHTNHPPRRGWNQRFETLREQVPLQPRVKIPLNQKHKQHTCAGGVTEMNYDSTSLQMHWALFFIHTE